MIFTALLALGAGSCEGAKSTLARMHASETNPSHTAEKIAVDGMTNDALALNETDVDAFGPDDLPDIDDAGPDEDLDDDSNIGIPGDPNYRINACGNGIRNFEEQCDDGNFDNFDSCNNVCGRPTCGNAVLEINEECDDGNNTDGDGCSTRCLYERCGNERIDTIGGNVEQCDDGNLKAGDGCSRACMFEICGNAILDPGEQCDDGGKNNPSGPCTQWCRFEPACPVTDAR
jgi:cysteine-rich repeat protein